MTIARPRLRHTCLALMLAVGNAALALAYGNPVAWALIALPAAALVLRMRVPPRFAQTLTWISRGLIAALAVGGTDVAPAAGLGLSVLAGFFLFDEMAFPSGRVALPAILSVLLAAAFDRRATHVAMFAWVAAALLLVWLASGIEGAARPRRLAVLALFVAPSAILGEAMIRFLPWAQPQVERATERFLTPPSGEAGETVEIGASPELGGVEQLTLVKRPVLRLWSAHPIALRTAVYTRFNGRIWSVGSDLHPSLALRRADNVAAPNEWSKSVPGEWLVPPGLNVRAVGDVARVVIAAPLNNVLPAPSAIQAVRSNEPNMSVDAFGLVLAPSRAPAIYGFKHASRPEPAPEADAKMVAECLTLPPAIDARVRALAEKLGPADASVDEKIRRTVADLQSRCRYSVNVGRWKSGDRVSEFLFDKKKGYCEYFATSAVLLLRLQGVPARYVTGFSVSSMNRRGAYYLVRTTDAYAWAEALVPGVGWADVDAVPPGDYAAVQDEMAMSAGEELMERMRARWSELMARWHEGGGLRGDLGDFVRSPVPLIAVVITAAGFILWRRRRRAARSRVPAFRDTDIDPALRSCFAKLEQVWVRSGHARPRHRAPMEHVRALPDASEALRTFSAEVVESFYRTAYGGQPAAADETARFAAELDRILQSL